VTTDRLALASEANPDTGYRRLVPTDGWPHVVRTDLSAERSDAGTDQPVVEVLLTVAHLSDLHVCDSQSPARVEYLDRWADPDSPIVDVVGEVGTYRAQDMMTAQVVDSCVRAVNTVECGPVGGATLDFALITGDNTDNAHANELGWYVTLLEGGPLEPDSGDRSRYEGVADDDAFDERFWHPETEKDDIPRTHYGFPKVPGLLDAIRAPFTASGLDLEWLAVHGNHDKLLQGTVVGDRIAAAVAVGPNKPIGLPEGLRPDEVAELLSEIATCVPDAIRQLGQGQLRSVTPDPARRLTTRAEFVGAHFGPAARPPGHGFTDANRVSGAAYYRYDHHRVTVLVLDTVDEFGGWQGSLDLAQFSWLRAELTAADADRRYVVLASHHPLETMINPTEGTGGRRVLADELAAELAQHPSVVLWLAGHTHEVSVAPGAGYWQVVAPSLIDWPQQGRIVELMRADGQLRVAATMIDHAGPAPWDGSIDSTSGIAGLSRELAANDWQYRKYSLAENPRSGPIDQRNVILLLDDPWA
jgi:metallophosphoesterase (TIGR03767 family)